MTFIYRRRIPVYPVEGKPLGRNVHFDSRSEAHAFGPIEPQALATILWPRYIGALDQGNLGSCTGNALVGSLGSAPDFEQLPAGHADLTEALAVKIYSLATTLDPYPGSYPPNDTGSDGIDVCKAAVKMGLIGGYSHCFDLPTMQQAMMERTTIVGINWYDSFDNPSSNGTVSISANAQIRGGHEIECIGMDMERKMFLFENSWGPDWGYNGTFQFSFATMTRLLAEEGDCTVPLPLAIAPPPPPPPPEPAPLSRESELAAVAGPWAAQTRTRADLVILKEAILHWKARAGIE